MFTNIATMAKGLKMDDAVIKYSLKIKKIPHKIKEILPLLEEDLRRTNGKPYNCGWKHFGPLKQLGNDCFHCHLNHNYVAVWRVDEATKPVHCYITYVGTHEKAPY